LNLNYPVEGGFGKNGVLRRSTRNVEEPENIAVAVCDMSKAFISGIETEFPNAEVVVDWFHVVKLFTSAVDEVRRKEAKKCSMPSGLRWAVLKNADGSLTERQQELIDELESYAEDTAKAW